MKDKRIVELYKKFYYDINFDRAGLFEEIKKKYYCNTAIYPGCSIHITPAFYFPHVVFIDISDNSKEFFSNTESVLDVINSNKKYKSSVYINCLDNDYTKQLPIRENNYDLLIAIYAEKVIQSCKKYVKPGGIIVTNNYHNDALEVLNDGSIILDAIIRRKGKRYMVHKSNYESLIRTLKEYSTPTKSMRNSSKGIEYVDNECYFVLKKIR